MRVVAEPCLGSGFAIVDLVGVRSGLFRGGVFLSAGDLSKLIIEEAESVFTGNALLHRLGIESVLIRLAFEYDPFFGLSISRVDPLPHQLDAVYNHMLRAWRCRFLLADDAGAGKTIMAGLLLKELKLRGLVERVLIVCPANLAFQWRREMKDRFEESFELVTGSRLREAYSVNVWDQQPQVITSMDLAKLEYVLPGVQSAQDWDLVIVDEAHRFSARDAEHKSERYKLGELLREKSTHFLLLTATPHKGDPDNFCLFLQLLDQEAYADVKSIEEAMARKEAPFYLRRTKEAMLGFPERQPDGSWMARKLFTERIPKTVPFDLDGAEFDLYRAVTDYVKAQSRRAAERGDDRRARAIGFLMALFQRRMASSTHSLKESLGRRRKRLKELLESVSSLGELEIPNMPSEEELEEMEAAERDRLEQQLERYTLAQRKPELEAEIADLDDLIKLAEGVEAAGHEIKLRTLREQMTQQGIFQDKELRLLLFTEYKDTLDYLVAKLREWGLSVGCIHGGMKPGSRDEPGTRLYAEREFWDLKTQVLVATEAAGEGINLQCCNVLFNYDIPWNPNRLEQRMGRIHRYGQKKPCLIFNFVARNTVEGRVLQKLMDKLQEIRDALQEDSVFDVIGEVLPSNQVEKLLRDFYAGLLGEEDIHHRLEVQVNKDDFERICRSALESLSRNKLNLDLLIEQRAMARERRIVPETIERFFRAAAMQLGIELRPVPGLPMSHRVGRLPAFMHEVASTKEWRLPPLARNYDRVTFDRDVSERDGRFEWVTPGHPLFEAVRRKIEDDARSSFQRGAVFYELERDEPGMLEVFTAAVADGTGKVLHERLFVIETTGEGHRRLREPSYILGLTVPDAIHDAIPQIPQDDALSQAFLYERALQAFLSSVDGERTRDLDTVERHVRLCFDELLRKRNEVLTRHLLLKDTGDPKAEGLVELEVQKVEELTRRRDRRIGELQRQRGLSLQGIQRIATALVLPHPERAAPEVSNLRPNPETEEVAMQGVVAFEEARGAKVEDVHLDNLGYDLRSLHPDSGELRLIEVKGIGAATGTICLTPNERRVAEVRPDVYWLYVVTNCNEAPTVEDPIKNPARLDWHEVKKVDHYSLSVKAAVDGGAMLVSENPPRYGGVECT